MSAILVAMAVLAGAAVQSSTPEAAATDMVARAHVQDLARCAVARRPDKVRDLLRLDYRSEVYADRLWQEAQRQWNCLDSGKLRFGGVVFAGALAEELVERNPGALAASLTASAALTLPPVVARSEPDVMAYCTVRAAPDATAALFATVPGSADERNALGTLGPTLGKCLVAGAKGTFNAAGLRALLALAAWRMLDNRALYMSKAQ